MKIEDLYVLFGISKKFHEITRNKISKAYRYFLHYKASLMLYCYRCIALAMHYLALGILCPCNDNTTHALPIAKQLIALACGYTPKIAHFFEVLIKG